jgi:tetratricopeptide (TPR) repeat protein
MKRDRRTGICPLDACASLPVKLGVAGAMPGRVLAGVLLLAGSALLNAASIPSSASEPATPVTPREFFNAGTQKLQEGKLREAEALLQSALSAQVEQFQRPALYNLGHVRFAQGVEELKKGPSARTSAARGQQAAHSADDAIGDADEALAGVEIQKMVAAYLRGKGARRELREAAKAVRQALEKYGDTLAKWQRASGDFKSVVELNSQDADARQNSEVLDRSIAKLIDSIRQMQQAAANLGQKKQQLGEKMKQLKGKIPEADMPPGAAGEDEEEEEQPMGQKPGEQEKPGKSGEEEMPLSPEQAGWLLEGFKLGNERRLPMGQKETGEPKNRARKPW